MRSLFAARFNSFLLIIIALFVLGLAAPAIAQVTAPVAASFSHSDADFAASTSFTFEFFQCTSIVAGQGQGCAPQPFQTGATVAKSAVTTISPVNQFGNNRQFSLTGGLLPAAPLGVPFVATLTAVGDAAQGVSNSARSAASNPFYLGLRALTPAGNVRTQ